MVQGRSLRSARCRSPYAPSLPNCSSCASHFAAPAAFMLPAMPTSVSSIKADFPYIEPGHDDRDGVRWLS
jgi:hypothetical protein